MCTLPSTKTTADMGMGTPSPDTQILVQTVAVTGFGDWQVWLY